MFAVSRTRSSIVAFAGVDPGVVGSGKLKLSSVATSKRGSPQLRKALFQRLLDIFYSHSLLAVSCHSGRFLTTRASLLTSVSKEAAHSELIVQVFRRKNPSIPISALV